MRQLHGVNVGEGSIVSEHLCINCTNHVLLTKLSPNPSYPLKNMFVYSGSIPVLHLLGRNVGRTEVLLQNSNFSNNDLILLLLGA